MDKRYQVFVSSTYADLKEERQSIIQTLIELDCIPAGMELFPAADEDQFEFIKTVIDDCDYYLLIIAGRYGSVAPDGTSYTEKEYDYARSKGLKILAFVHENPGEIKFSKSEAEPVLHAKLEAFRAKAMTSTVAKLWSDPSQLPSMVAISLPQTIRRHPAVGWVRANQVASTDVLAELNEVRKENQALKEQIQNMTPDVEDLAGLNDLFVLSGTHKPSGIEYKWELKVTWGDLFLALGPHILSCPNDFLMESRFNYFVRRLSVENNRSPYYNWTFSDKYFQQFKIQMKALKLAVIEMRPTSDGQLALFWELTDKGEALLLQLGAAKKPKDQEPISTNET